MLATNGGGIGRLIGAINLCGLFGGGKIDIGADFSVHIGRAHDGSENRGNTPRDRLLHFLQVVQLRRVELIGRFRLVGFREQGPVLIHHGDIGEGQLWHA